MREVSCYLPPKPASSSHSMPVVFLWWAASKAECSDPCGVPPGAPAVYRGSGMAWQLLPDAFDQFGLHVRRVAHFMCDNSFGNAAQNELGVAADPAFRNED